ncbi:hypothetical protein [Halospeciosus flavus]|uniref:hypothetical protein n=1 Tax=Halospeciosus flavus TaxID=3032283 RepID=UPI00361F4C36
MDAADVVAVHEDAVDLGPNPDLLRSADRAFVFADAEALLAAVSGEETSANVDGAVRRFDDSAAVVSANSDD